MQVRIKGRLQSQSLPPPGPDAPRPPFKTMIRVDDFALVRYTPAAHKAASGSGVGSAGGAGEVHTAGEASVDAGAAPETAAVPM